MGNCFKNEKIDRKEDILENEKNTINIKDEKEPEVVEFKMESNPFSKEIEKVANRQNLGKETYVKMEMKK